jgi:hypothetical protein
MIKGVKMVTATETIALTSAELDLLDAWWRAANYLSVGQIYLLDNPLLTEPLRPEHVKPRLLGHWGTTPGLNLIYAHLNRVIRNWDLDMIYVAGPGHGGPGLVANTFLEGTYTELTRRSPGMWPDWRNCSGSSHSPAVFRHTWHRKHPAQFTRAESSAIHSRTPTARHLTTRS